jgi:drug/metabolite transporter (DMT)-like permease
MSPGLWGCITAVGWGTSDFIARFSGGAVGHHAALFGMLLTGSILLSLWVWLADARLVWETDRLWLIGLSGLSIMLATLWLYQGLARGPISIVSPIVGSYPALIVAFAVIGGLRPSLAEWAAMAGTMVGVAIVARSADLFALDTSSSRDLRTTVLISLASAAAFAVGVFAAQLAVPVYGEVQTTWLSRITSLAILLLLLVWRGPPRIPARWWPAVISQGCFDTGGYLALYAGSHGDGAEIAAVTASAFGAVTTLLAWVFLRESIGLVQWLGIAMVFAGVAVLSS